MRIGAARNTREFSLIRVFDTGGGGAAGIPPSSRHGERVKCPVCQKKTTRPPGRKFVCNGCGWDEEKKEPVAIERPKLAVCRFCGATFVAKEGADRCAACAKKGARLRVIKCARCGAEVAAHSLTRRYCDACKKAAAVKYNRENARKKATAAKKKAADVKRR